MNNTKIVLVGGSLAAIKALKAALGQNAEVVVATTADGPTVSNKTPRWSLDGTCDTEPDLSCECDYQECQDDSWAEEESRLPHNKPYLANSKRDIYRSSGKVGKRR